MWDGKTKALPVVVEALTPVPQRLKDNLRTIEGGSPVELIQRCALLEGVVLTAQELRRNS